MEAEGVFRSAAYYHLFRSGSNGDGATGDVGRPEQLGDKGYLVSLLGTGHLTQRQAAIAAHSATRCKARRSRFLARRAPGRLPADGDDLPARGLVQRPGHEEQAVREWRTLHRPAQHAQSRPGQAAHPSVVEGRTRRNACRDQGPPTPRVHAGHDLLHAARKTANSLSLMRILPRFPGRPDR